MSVRGLGWLGVRTDRFEETVALYRNLLGLQAFQEGGASTRFRLGCHFRGPDGNVYELVSGGRRGA